MQVTSLYKLSKFKHSLLQTGCQPCFCKQKMFLLL